jgi:diguanylate cyclase (GGDEF)-like protein
MPLRGEFVVHLNVDDGAQSTSDSAIELRREAYGARTSQVAHYDTLTGLPTLAYIDEIVRHAIGRARAATTGFSIVLLKLDEFGLVDANFGREVGDELLSSITVALTDLIGEHDTAARAGSDEFLVILTKISDADEAAAITDSLLDAIAKPRRLVGRYVQVTASAGIALYPSHGEDLDNLLRNATAAMQLAKAGRNRRWGIHSADVEHRARQRQLLTKNLRNAIEHHELSLHYQPLFETSRGDNCGVEALARWYRPGGDSIGPAVFIRYAEKNGLISALGAWVLQEACSAVALWRDPGGKVPILGVNVSTHQIGPEFFATLCSTLERTGFPPERLELEITESILIADPEFALTCLEQWKRLGVRVALDDFGTGFSSLSYLSRLPVDRLKVDRSLISRITIDRKTAAIVYAVISLGTELGFEVLAEGVETEEQFKLLMDLDCPQVQGYLFTPPIGAAEARSLLARKWGARSTTALNMIDP